MFALIKKEIEDCIAYYIIAAIIVTIMVLIFARIRVPEIPIGVITFTWFVLPIIMTITSVFFCGMGVGQIYPDRNRKSLAFVATLSTTRTRIFLSKIFAGTICIVLMFTAVFIAAQVWLKTYLDILVYHLLVRDALATAFFVNLAGYSFGLMHGFSDRRIIPTLGACGLAMLFCSIVISKGIKPADTLIVIVPFAISCVFIAWRRFKRAVF